MRVTDCLLVVSWLASRMTADATEKFCSPPLIWPKQPFSPFLHWLGAYSEVEVTVPELHKTAHMDVAMEGWVKSSVKSYEYVTFNAHTSLHVSVSHDSRLNSTEETCPFDRVVQSSFMSGIRYWSLAELIQDIYPWNGRLHYEHIDNNSTVRDMTVSHERVCFAKQQVLMDLYYVVFSDFGARISVSGRNISTIHYDFPVAEPVMLMPNRKIPRGVTCENFPGAREHHRPDEFDSFSATVVMVYSNYRFSAFREEFYDNKMKLASSVVIVFPGTTFESRFGHSYLHVVRDYNTDLRYVIDIDRGNCTIESMANSTSPYFFAGPWDPAGVNARKSPGLFDLSVFPNFVYQDTTMERDHLVNIFAASRVNWPQHGDNTTVEVYYTADGWVTEGMNFDDPDVLLRFDRSYATAGGRNKLFGFWYETTALPWKTEDLIPNATHVFDYKEGVDEFSVFDISACYERPEQSKRVVFSLPGCYCGLVRYKPTLLESTLREYISRETGIELIRVGEIEVVISSSTFVDIWVTLFEIPHIKGDIPGSLSRVTLIEAVNRLKGVVDAVPARPIVVSYPEGDQSMTTIRGSLRTGTEAMSSATKRPKGHSTGTMVAVGAAAACLGLVLGLTAFLLAWKRYQSPYLVQ